jgi:hypothetical protein
LIYGLSLIAEGEKRWELGGVFVAGGLLAGIAAVVHARRHPAPLLDLAASTIPTFSLSTLTAGFAARVAISMTPYLLPLMFQIGFGASPFQAGIMLLVYMVGNLSMKSMTTSLLHRFGFRDVIRVNGTLCALSLLACGLLSPATAAPVVYFVLLVAGMTRSMNFTSMSTLAFADVPAQLRAGATTLAGHVAASVERAGCGRRRAGAGRISSRARGDGARSERFSLRVLRRGRADGARDAMVAAPRSQCGRRAREEILSLGQGGA